MVLIICGLLIYLALQTVIFWSLVGSQDGAFFSLPGARKIGVISLEGPINKIQPQLDQLQRYEEKANVEALLLDIDSPGGRVGPSQELSSAISDFSDGEKPVVAFVRSTGASGAYYVASSADTIVVNPGSLVGSIGVIMKFISAEELVEKVGLEYHVVKSGEFKDLGSPFREMSTRDREMLRNLVMDVYDQFINHVSEARGQLNQSQVEKLADGRVFTGKQSAEKGLVDLTGGRRKAIDVAKKAAGIEGEVELQKPLTKDLSPFTRAAKLIDSLGSFLRSRESSIQLLYQMPEGRGFTD